MKPDNKSKVISILNELPNDNIKVFVPSESSSEGDVLHATVILSWVSNTSRGGN